MSDEILSVIYLILILILVLPGFFYANKNCYRPAHESQVAEQEPSWFSRKTKSWKTL